MCWFGSAWIWTQTPQTLMVYMMKGTMMATNIQTFSVTTSLVEPPTSFWLTNSVEKKFYSAIIRRHSLDQGIGQLTATAVASKNKRVMIVSPFTAEASRTLFSISFRVVVFSFRVSSAKLFREIPLPRSKILDNYITQLLRALTRNGVRTLTKVIVPWTFLWSASTCFR